ncbi:PAS domain-containing sensor histidine kinase [Pleionea sp. CnH1-48]|uniref:PAS domain-containing protein n=1 Tax=Pleionea sp. CnH1-48 TaxID=2954494 RepID=UPI0021130F76|nr:PAS domain-containing sensor histidine kinase [Pleionea sp. CnH1-48]
MLSDELLKNALDNTMDMIMILEANFDDVGASRIVYVNRAFCETMGYTQDELLGKNPRMLQGDDTDKRTRMDIRVALKHKKPIRREILNVTQSGESIQLDITLTPLKNDNDDVTHFLAIERVVQS